MAAQLDLASVELGTMSGHLPLGLVLFLVKMVLMELPSL